MVCFIHHALHVLSLGWPLLSPFSRPMKMATTKANQDMTCTRGGGLEVSGQIPLLCDQMDKPSKHTVDSVLFLAVTSILSPPF